MASDNLKDHLSSTYILPTCHLLFWYKEYICMWSLMKYYHDYSVCSSFPVAPPTPHTISPEWEAATKEKLLRQKANPIEGISSSI